MWKIKHSAKRPKLRNPVLIGGLPGIGNVGKIAVDFMVDSLKAKKLFSLDSYDMPNSVFVNEKNLVELPSIDIYYKQLKKKGKKIDLLFLSGDFQPTTENSCYEFSDKVLDECAELGCNEVLTLGGIGLKEIPSKPKLYCTGADHETVKSYSSGYKVSRQLYGVVGPIAGVSGVLVGLAGKRKMKAAALLAETYAHPMYLGARGAREILGLLNKKLGLKMNLGLLDKEIKELEDEMIEERPSAGEMPFMSKKLKRKPKKETDYIG